jgi:single stranded DNA-binding protein (ssb)
MNKVFLIGNLGADPELRSTNNGISVCTFRIGVSRRFKDANGENQTDWINIVAWRQLGELCAKYLAKGRKVAVAGALQSRSYEDKAGNKRVAYEVVADDIEFLTPRGETPSSSPASFSSPEHDSFEDVAGFTEMEDSALPF